MRTTALIALGFTFLASCNSGMVMRPPGSDDARSRSLQGVLAAGDAQEVAMQLVETTTSAVPTGASIEARAMTTLGSCASVSRNQNQVMVVVPSACTTRSGDQIVGSLTINVALDRGMTVATVTFTNVVWNGRSLSGTVAVATVAGATWTITYTITDGSMTATGDLTLVADSNAFTLDGTIVVADNAASAGRTNLTVVLSGVLREYSSCYPSAGTVTVRVAGRVVAMYTFTPATAASQTVVSEEGAFMIPAALHCSTARPDAGG